MCCRENCTRSGSDKVRLSPNACLSVCNFHGRFSGILFWLNRPLWTPHCHFCLVTLVRCHSPGECNFVGNTRPRTRCVWFNGSTKTVEQNKNYNCGKSLEHSAKYEPMAKSLRESKERSHSPYSVYTPTHWPIRVRSSNLTSHGNKNDKPRGGKR